MDDKDTRSRVIELYKRGNQLFKSHRYAEALKIFEEALVLSPNDLYVLTGMGDVLRRMNDFSTASGYYRQVLAIDPDNMFALRGVGDALRSLQLYRDAITNWEKYLQLSDYKDIFVLTRVADSYKALGEFDKALEYYRKGLSIEPGDCYALMGLADLHHKHGFELQAVQYYDQAIANGVNQINILTIAANLHWRLRNHERARVCYEKTLSQDPDNAYALYGLGNYYRWKCDYRRAAELWEKILENGPGTVNLLARLGDAYRNLGRYDAAERVYKNNLERGYDMFTLVGMIKLHCLQGRLQDACDCYDKLLSNEMEDRRVFADIEILLLKRNRREDALRFLHHALERQKSNQDVGRIIGERIMKLDGFYVDSAKQQMNRP